MYRRNFLDTSKRDPQWITTTHRSKVTAINAAKRVKSRGPSIIISPTGKFLQTVR